MAGYRSRFVERFGGVYENSRWVAERAAAAQVDMDNLDLVAEVMARCVDTASASRQLDLIRSHPELAGNAQTGRGLSKNSVDEQASAGLHRCTTEQREQFRSLNHRYRKKFGFPFVTAVRGQSRVEILKAFARRLENERVIEIDVALREIHKIARLRLRAMEGAR
ncbi:MAG: 2-oxo-4-hydroxy-4-carboxy-5-ureidoimidazoline decarboxylase [Rhodospirillaceae bacterium]|nr:2-oxo-4-hydroxy-4-carboxy-5-ureidoimidazoline decarboxylase [Rhodospirillaceae bacterium]MDD9999233.1 2-oxo-4-hydroxy-4-carboxy-5-ureidoimidazoline decarboxylase [Rhodospirillaceae bacterium]MDE0362176.1 2-oxo-4-hydroxy-4-carboxy-5-ureidoimidazoline decarboxylase [Rhodospirillaceae bacterium]